MVAYDQKNTNPFTATIPEPIWSWLFRKGIEEEKLAFINKPFDQLTRTDFPTSSNQAFICLLIHYKTVPREDLLKFINTHFKDLREWDTLPLCATAGRLDVLKELIEIPAYSTFKKVEYAKDKYDTFKQSFEFAAENGQIHVMEWIEQNCDFPVSFFINHKLLLKIAKYGQITVLDWIEKKRPQMITAFFDENRTEPYIFAGIIENGQTESLKWLAKRHPYCFTYMLKQSENSLIHAFRNNHIDTCIWILKFSIDILKFVDEKPELEELYNRFSKNILSDLHEAKEKHTSSEPFLADQQTPLKACFYVTKNLIQQQLNDEIRFLFSIPKVRELIENKKELLELALKTKNREVYRILRRNNISENERQQIAQDLFALGLLYADGYLFFKGATGTQKIEVMNQQEAKDAYVQANKEEMERFLFIFANLPLELQKILCYRIEGSSRDRMTLQEVNEGLRYNVAAFINKK